MADAFTVPTSGGNTNPGAPVTAPQYNPDLNRPLVTDPAPSPGQAGHLGGVDPQKLPPELQEIYRNMQGDYTRKTTELSAKEKEWESERSKHKTLEQKFKDLEVHTNQYREQERTWKEWTPFLQAASQPGVMEKLQAVLQGKPMPVAQAQNPTGEQTVARLLEGVGDDDYINGAILNRGMATLKEQMRSEILAEARTNAESFGQQAVRGVTEWVQNYMTLADEMLSLRMQHQYGLTPKTDTNFDPQRVVQFARQYGLTSLPAAYQLAYGADDASRMAAAANETAAAERERIEKDAYERGVKEAQMRFQSQQAGITPPDGVTLPRFSATKPGSYGNAERELNERMSALNMGRR